ncbi:MAG: NAD-dependent epimerase [Desulfovibrio sp.]|nr:NAD-dependent epimerase [Desulfovibrio sp.]
MHALVTGAAGFIGFHLARLLLGQGHRVTGIDNLCDYYSVRLKEDRLHLLEGMEGFSFVKGDLADKACMERLFAEGGFTHVVNLAAQAGVRYSLINPMAYISSNIVGFANILEGCRRHAVRHLVFASSSSVYGLDATQPYTPHQAASHPVSLYAATKRSDELMAHAYAHLYGIPCTGLRFFTVYGPWGRPDMALSIFASAMRRGEPIKIFNQGRMRRDFTYIDDIVEPMARLLDMPPAANPGWDAASADPATSSAPWRILNLGRGQTVELGRFIETLEEVMGRAAVKEYLPMQDGDVLSTWSDISDAEALTGWTPRTSLKEGIARFYEWFASYYDPSRC